MADLLLGAGADVGRAQSSGETPLMRDGRPDGAACGGEGGAEVDAQDGDGRTPLDLVSSGRWADRPTAELLERLGAAAPR